MFHDLLLTEESGEKLHNVMSSRFDRVENILVRMERFLDFQKPIDRIDIYVQLDSDVSSFPIGDEAVPR